MKLVIDASVLVKCFIQERETEKAHKLLHSLEQGDHLAFIPNLAIYEVTSALSRRIKDENIVQKHLSSLYSLIEFGILNLVPESRSITKRSILFAKTETSGPGSISPYDALYHSLAFEVDASMLTSDLKHYSKCKDLLGRVINFTDFEL